MKNGISQILEINLNFNEPFIYFGSNDLWVFCCMFWKRAQHYCAHGRILCSKSAVLLKIHDQCCSKFCIFKEIKWDRKTRDKCVLEHCKFREILLFLCDFLFVDRFCSNTRIRSQNQLKQVRKAIWMQSLLSIRLSILNHTNFSSESCTEHTNKNKLETLFPRLSTRLFYLSCATGFAWSGNNFFYFRMKTIEFNDYRNLNDAHFNSSWNKNSCGYQLELNIQLC